MIGLDLDDLSVDGSITKALPNGGEIAGRKPVDRGKQGTKRSVAADGDGIPLHLLASRANDHDSPLLEPTLAGIPDTPATTPSIVKSHLTSNGDWVLNPYPGTDTPTRATPSIVKSLFTMRGLDHSS